jgi:hypothetical protein
MWVGRCGPTSADIAAALHMPADTVRGWLRRARHGLETIRRRAADQPAWTDPDMFARLAPQPTLLAEGLNTLLAAADATARLLAPLRRHSARWGCGWRGSVLPRRLRNCVRSSMRKFHRDSCRSPGLV